MRCYNPFISIRLIIILFLVFTSCGDEFNPNTETYMIGSVNKKWLVNSDLYEQYSMVDSLSNTVRYFLDSEWTAFNSSKSTSGLFGLQDREFAEYEVLHQVFLSHSNNSFSIELTASEPPEGTILEIQLNRHLYNYDLQQKRLKSISTRIGRRPESTFINDKIVDLPFLSQAIQHDTLEINDVEYTNALEFVLGDFEDQWTDSTIVSITVAKEVGLLQYRMNNGHVFNRLPLTD